MLSKAFKIDIFLVHNYVQDTALYSHASHLGMFFLKLGLGYRKDNTFVPVGDCIRLVNGNAWHKVQGLRDPCNFVG